MRERLPEPTTERSGLLPANVIPLRQRLWDHAARVGTPALLGVDLMLNSVDTFAIGAVGNSTLLAYPTISAATYPYICLASLSLCAAKLGLDVADIKKTALHFRERILELSTLNHVANCVINAANVDTFVLQFSIAGYVALDAILNHIGSEEVDASNLVYIAGFVAPSALIGLAYAALEVSKNSWIEAESRFAQGLKYSHHAIRSTYYAGNLNSLLAFGLAFVGISEIGDVNPYYRLAIFSSALFAGMMLVMASQRGKVTAEWIDRGINAICMLSYMAGLFGGASRNQLGERNTIILLAGFSSLVATSLVVGACLKPATPTASVVNHSMFAASAPAHVAVQEPTVRPALASV